MLDRSFRSYLHEIKTKILNNKGRVRKKILFEFDKTMQEYLKVNSKKIKKPFKDVEELYIDEMQVFVFNDKKIRNQKSIIFIHGGAYFFRPNKYHINFAKKLAEKLDAKVYMPMYLIAPEFTYEKSYDVMLKLYNYVLNENGIDNISLIGDSSGGGFALGLLQSLKKLNISRPKRSILISPWVDISTNNPKIEQYESYDPMLAKDTLNKLAIYWSNGTDLKDYRLSPKFGDCKDIGEISFFVGTYEIFLPDILELSEIMENENIEYNLIVKDKMLHDYPLFLHIPEGKEAFKQIIDILAK